MRATRFGRMSGIMADKYEPKTMHHPHFRKGKIEEVRTKDAAGKEVIDYNGDPGVFPPVVVKSPDEEAACRAMGYLFHGEAPPPPAEYSEYPVMLNHPGHGDAIEPEHIPVKTDAGISITIIPGTPEKFPPRQANSPAHERELEKAGYKRK